MTGERELPGGVSLSQSNDEAIVSLPDGFSSQARNIYGRCASLPPERKHMKPASSFEDSEGKRLQFVLFLFFQSYERPGWLAPLFCRVSW